MIRFVPVIAVCLALTLVFPSFAAVQTKLPVSDPQAVAYAAQSILALTGGTPIADAKLTGTATWTVGSDNQSGSVTLMGKGTSESRTDLGLSGGNRTEIRNSFGGFPQGAWVGSDGVSHSYAMHNCWTDANWLFPVLSSLSNTDPNIILSYVGLESRSGVSVQHLRSYRALFQSISSDALTEQLSTMDFYLDATSFLPVAVTFSVHPDDDANVTIPVEIDYSNYQITNGAQLPLHVQKFLQGGLVLDLVITSASPNTGLSDSNFNIQ